MDQRFYQVGGSLPANAKSYIKREADDQLYAYLKEGKYCYVLNARQVGKSSLRVHVSKRLEDEGYSCVNIDLTTIGSEDITADEWYFSFLYQVIEQLGLEEEPFMEWWDKNNKLTVVNRFSKIFDLFILGKTSKKMVIFIDEVDAILGIKRDFSTNDFFAVIRTFYNLRSEDKRYEQISFSLFGVATPEDLMRDSSRTPFNIAHGVTIEQFKLEESLSLVEGLVNQKLEGRFILERIFEWTSGTPYLTQKLLDYIVAHPLDELEEIDHMVDKLFIQENFKEINISNIQNRIISNEKYNVKMLYLIGDIIAHGKRRAEDGSLEQVYLKLSGLVKKVEGNLVYTNKIYRMIFNQAWLNETLEKIDRPFSTDLQRWLESNKRNFALLKNEILEKANQWALERDDLTSSESEYLRLSNQQRQDEVLKREKRRFHRNIILLLSLFLLSVLLGSYFYIKKERESTYRNYLAQGEKYFSHQEYDKAIKFYLKAINIENENNQNYFKLAKAYSENEDYKNAIEALNRGIALMPEYHQTQLGIIYNDLKFYTEAHIYFNRIIQDGRADYFTYYNLGNTYFREKRYPDAIKNYKKSIELNITYDRAYNDWGYTLLTEKRYPEAIEKYQQSVQINPRSYKSWNSMGIAYLALHQEQEAIVCFEKAIQVNPKHYKAYLNLFRSELLINQPLTEVKAYKKIFKGEKERLINYEIIETLDRLAKGEKFAFKDQWENRYHGVVLPWQPFKQFRAWAKKNENPEIRVRLLEAIGYFESYREQSN